MCATTYASSEPSLVPWDRDSCDLVVIICDVTWSREKAVSGSTAVLQLETEAWERVKYYRRTARLGQIREQRRRQWGLY